MPLVTIPFLKKIQFPKFSFKFAGGAASFVGVDIGNDSVKVVQLRKERERAVLETYGELKSARYFQGETGATGSGLVGHSDQSVVNLLTDVLRESNVTTKRAIFSVPSASSFVTAVSFPLLRGKELESAVSFEAKRYVPIPLQEVALDWQMLEEDEAERRMLILLVAVPQEVIAKYQRVAEAMGLQLEAVEVESFSLARSLLAGDYGVTAVIHWGALVTTLVVVDQGRIRMSHNFGRGSREITAALAHSLGVTEERAEAVKKEVGLSERPESREIVDVIMPIVDSALGDVERALLTYNRGAKQKVERIVLSGGGSSLAGLADHVASRFGLETAVGNPFGRTMFPPFLQPVLKDIAPNFAVAVGLALRQIASS